MGILPGHRCVPSRGPQSREATATTKPAAETVPSESAMPSAASAATGLRAAAPCGSRHETRALEDRAIASPRRDIPGPSAPGGDRRRPRLGQCGAGPVLRARTWTNPGFTSRYSTSRSPCSAERIARGVARGSGIGLREAPAWTWIASVGSDGQVGARTAGRNHLHTKCGRPTFAWPRTPGELCRAAASSNEESVNLKEGPEFQASGCSTRRTRWSCYPPNMSHVQVRSKPSLRAMNRVYSRESGISIRRRSLCQDRLQGRVETVWWSCHHRAARARCYSNIVQNYRSVERRS